MAAFQSCPTCQASLILCVGSIVDIGAIFDFEIGGLPEEPGFRRMPIIRAREFLIQHLIQQFSI